MRALFYRKLDRQLRTGLAVGLLLLCLLGTHWIGFSHGISHTGLPSSSQMLVLGVSSCDQNATLTHSSASCKLFDALTLAGFVAPSYSASISLPHYASTHFFLVERVDPQSLSLAYQSQAPPLPAL
jgi:ABC-type nitrate/sulfonate/bicarbonate transport system permease component